MSTIDDSSLTKTEIESQIETLRRRCDAALQRRLENPNCLTPATLIRILAPVIEKYLEAGLVLEEVAKALQEEGFSITKGHLVRNLGAIRAENGLSPIKRGKKTQQKMDAPAARKEWGQGGAQPPVPTPAATAPAVATATAPTAAPAPAPRPTPLPQPQTEEIRPRWMTDELWEMKPKIDKILKVYPPTPDREYPELANSRVWTDKTGKKWDVLGDEKPTDEKDYQEWDKAKIRYYIRWRQLMVDYGIAQEINSTMVPRYKIADKYLQPLTVDLDELIKKHLD